MLKRNLFKEEEIFLKIKMNKIIHQKKLWLDQIKLNKVITCKNNNINSNLKKTMINRLKY